MEGIGRVCWFGSENAILGVKNGRWVGYKRGQGFKGEGVLGLNVLLCVVCDFNGYLNIWFGMVQYADMPIDKSSWF